MNKLREKAAQLVIPRLDGNSLGEGDYFNHAAALVDEGIGGFILFGGTIAETPHAIRRLQERTKTPLLITSDIERGLGQQLLGGTGFPNQWAVAEAIDRTSSDDISLLHAMLVAVRDECIAAGIHAVFSPVADVNVSPDNPIICTRSFGEDSERVAWFVAGYVKGLQQGLSTGHRPLTSDHSLFACAKHFPGHGDTATDSHTSLPVINADLHRLYEVELPPFKAAIDAGVAMIMVGHLQVPALEPEPIPATFSKRIVTDLLRKKMGFKGLVVTDALDMGALKVLCDEGESAVRSLEAGCDILLHPSEPLQVLDAVIKAVESGRLSEGRVEEAFNRVSSLKSRSAVGSQMPAIGRGQAIELAEKLARKAIKIRKGKGLSNSENITCLVVDDDGDGGVAATFINAMKERIPGLHTISNPLEINGGTIVIPVFSKVAAWKGNSGLSKESLEKIKNSISRAGWSVVISFASPYILNNFDADVKIDAFDPAGFMQVAAVEKLME